MKSPRLKLVKSTEMRPVTASGRKPNAAYRVREHLTEDEMARLLAALRRNRHGHRDWLIGLLIYRHGLRVSEACDLRWDDVDLTKRTIIVRRLKGSNGYALAAKGMDTRRLQHFLGHASITNTVRYTAMSPEPFKDVWR